MTMHALALPAPIPTSTLRILPGGTASRESGWWEKRAFLRRIVGGCPDHWWSPVARATAACTCDRF